MIWVDVFDMLVKDYKRIGDRIQQIRKQSGLSQDEHPLSCDYSSIIDKIDSLPPDKKQAAYSILDIFFKSSVSDT